MKNFMPRKYFEIWADEQAQNSILKGLLAFFVATNMALIISLTILSSKKPYLISINNKTNKINASKSIPENLIKKEITNTITRFIKLRHNWNDKTIEINLKKSTQLIAHQFKAKFFKANKENIKTAKSKKITQKFYLSEIKIDFKKKEVQVTGDRILIVEGLRATQPMTFKLKYTFGDRTLENPEGIYITHETLISSLTH